MPPGNFPPPRRPLSLCPGEAVAGSEDSKLRANTLLAPIGFPPRFFGATGEPAAAAGVGPTGRGHWALARALPSSVRAQRRRQRARAGPWAAGAGRDTRAPARGGPGPGRSAGCVPGPRRRAPSAQPVPEPGRGAAGPSEPEDGRHSPRGQWPSCRKRAVGDHTPLPMAERALAGNPRQTGARRD